MFAKGLGRVITRLRDREGHLTLGLGYEGPSNSFDWGLGGGSGD
jgi:hypothetical protein